MQFESQGLALTKLEITALLEFCGRDREQPQLCNVTFCVSEGRCRAYATTGMRSLEADNACEEGTNGEWSVSRWFLAQGKQLLGKDQILRLKFSHASLHSATVEQDGKEVASLGWPEDAASAQASFPSEASQRIRLPPARRKVARSATFDPDNLAPLSAMSRACGSARVDWFAPSSPTDPVYFRCESETTWTAIVLPCRVANDDGETEPFLETTKA